MKMIWSRDRNRKEERLETPVTSEKYSSYHDRGLNVSTRRSVTIYFYINAIQTSVFFIMQLILNVPINSKAYT
jgi:hypothetical protein